MTRRSVSGGGRAAGPRPQAQGEPARPWPAGAAGAQPPLRQPAGPQSAREHPRAHGRGRCAGPARPACAGTEGPRAREQHSGKVKCPLTAESHLTFC